MYLPYQHINKNFRFLCSNFLLISLVTEKKNKSGLEINTYTDSLVDTTTLKPKSSSANNCAYSVTALSANPLTGDIIYQQQHGLGASTSTHGGDPMSLIEPSSKYSPNYSGSKGSFRQQTHGNKQQQQQHPHSVSSTQGSAQGSYNSLHVGTPLHDQHLHIGGSQNGGSRNSSPTIVHPHAGAFFRHSTPAESLNGSGTTYFGAHHSGGAPTSIRSRVNSDSKCKPYTSSGNYPSESNSSNGGSKCKISAGSNSAGSGRKHVPAQSESNTSNNNNNNNSSSNPLRHIFRQSSKNFEFNRQLSAPAAENQNNYNSVFNLQHHANVLNNSHQYHGSPNTNSLNRTKKKRRSFKLNGR